MTANSRPHGRNLRKERTSETGRIYLITTITNERTPLFQDLYCGRHVVRTLMAESARAKTLAYVLMPDHLHWLLQLEQNATLQAVVQSIKSISAHRINHVLGRRGKIWQAGYYDHALRNDEDVVRVARYVVANPLRKSLVSRLGDYSLWDAIWIS